MTLPAIGGGEGEEDADFCSRRSGAIGGGGGRLWEFEVTADNQSSLGASGLLVFENELGGQYTNTVGHR